MDNYRLYIHKSRYARFIDDKQRRESWAETVQRLIDFYCTKFPNFTPVLNNGIRSNILDMEVMPSMRSLMTAGAALDRDNISGYNCSYIAVDNMRSFSEALYILMNGTGLGFSVERQYVNNLPAIADEFYETDTTIFVKDNKLGWATSLHELITLLYQGKVPKWDLSKLRPAGARLKTFGGRSSGPGPLNDLFWFTVSMFKKAAGRKLNSIECHDIMCKIGEIVVVGGVRRSALISLSNLSDDRMRAAKNGQWWEDYVHRALANNSVAYTEKPDIGVFMKEWTSLYESKSGERGIFNRVSANKQAKRTGRRETEGVEFGTNPCVAGDMIVNIRLADTENYFMVPVIEAVKMVEDGNNIQIRSKNIETGKVEYKDILSAMLTRKSAKVIKISHPALSQPLIVTPDHRIYTVNRGYVAAKDLLPTDELDFSK